MKLQDIYQSGNIVSFQSAATDVQLGTQTQAILITDCLLRPPVDGMIGPLTIAALTHFQKIKGLPLNSYFDKSLAKALIEIPLSAIPESERLPQPTVFEQAMHFSLAWEGTGYENVPGDYGGPTYCGVTWLDYNQYRSERGLSPLSAPENVRFMSMDEVYAIYKHHYWDRIWGDKLPRRIAIAVFDFELNAGTRGMSTLQGDIDEYRAANHGIKTLQNLLPIDTDGIMGPGTLAALNAELMAAGSEDWLLHKYFMLRETIYRAFASVPSQAQFLAGWINRSEALKQYLGVT